MERRHAINHHQKKKEKERKRLWWIPESCVFTYPSVYSLHPKREFVLKRGATLTLCWTFVVRGRNQVAFTDWGEIPARWRRPLWRHKGLIFQKLCTPAHTFVGWEGADERKSQMGFSSFVRSSPTKRHISRIQHGTFKNCQTKVLDSRHRVPASDRKIVHQASARSLVKNKTKTKKQTLMWDVTAVVHSICKHNQPRVTKGSAALSRPPPPSSSLPCHTNPQRGRAGTPGTVCPQH